MKENSNRLLVFISTLLAFSVLQSCKLDEQNFQIDSQRDMVLWYKQPGLQWHDGMPIGNGYMGAMVFGGIQHERIALNESTFWSGRPHDYNDPQAYGYFEKIKEFVFAGKFKEAEKMVNEHFYGKPVAQQAYQPLGDLLLDFKTTSDSIRDYYRELDMESGVVKISYLDGDVKMTREIFMSYPDHAMVMKVSADKPGRLFVEAKLKSHFTEEIAAGDNKLTLSGTWKYIPEKESWLIAKVEGSGMRFQTSLVAIPENGNLEKTDSSLIVRNANSVTFILTAATSFVNYADINGDPAAGCEKIMARIKGKSFSELKNTHLEDFSNLMGRVHLKIGDPSMNEKPTDERLSNLRNGVPDLS
jgi:alpha-L-fucosidase 2